mgnify:CR=1 FL=1
MNKFKIKYSNFNLVGGADYEDETTITPTPTPTLVDEPSIILNIGDVIKHESLGLGIVSQTYKLDQIDMVQADFVGYNGDVYSAKLEEVEKVDIPPWKVVEQFGDLYLKSESTLNFWKENGINIINPNPNPTPVDENRIISIEEDKLIKVKEQLSNIEKEMGYKIEKDEYQDKLLKEIDSKLNKLDDHYHVLNTSGPITLKEGRPINLGNVNFP